jgi:6-phosphogluconate dehydrogenase
MKLDTYPTVKLAIIGLGRMGSNMARRLLRDGHEIAAWNRTQSTVTALSKEGARGLSSIEDLRGVFEGGPVACWVMLPAGDVTEEMILRLEKILKPGDILVDGGNSYFKDDIRRAKHLKPSGIRYVDVGTSGGVWGLERGYSLMIGGDRSAVEELDPIFKSLAPGVKAASPTPSRLAENHTADRGYLYCGPAGAGHFVKMVHNGIEYGMMQALAEGFDILKGASREDVHQGGYHYDLDLREIAEVWRRGSVVSSWLLDLIAISLNQDPQLAGFEGHVPDSGEGRWTAEAAIEEGVPAHVISSALFTRFRSREETSFGEKLLSAMRKEFGGHVEAPVEKKAS